MSSGFHRDGDPTPQKQVQGQNYEAANNKLLIEFAHVEKNLLRKELMRKTDQVKAPNIAHLYCTTLHITHPNHSITSFIKSKKK